MSEHRKGTTEERAIRDALRQHYRLEEADDLRLPRFEPGVPYRVFESMHRGGMGRIVRVIDLRLDREMAMKVARGDDASADEALLAEARRLATLSHPFVIPVHECGRDADGRAYFTMPLVDGEDFSSLIARHHAGLASEWSMRALIDVLVKVCDCIVHAHARGIVHGDLKPGNVMLGAHGEILVLDWGLGRAIDERQSPRLVGTPDYMAPERLTGQPPSIRSDVFALGVVLWEVLAGTPNRGAPVHVANRHAKAPLVSIAEKATARTLSDRYASVADFRADLRAFLDDRVVSAHHTGPLAELTAWYRRHRRVAFATMAAIALGVVAAAIFIDRLRTERERAESAAYTATRRLEEIHDLAVIERIDAMRRRADTELWPIHPSRREAMMAWLADAEALAGRLATLEQSLASARAAVESLDDSRRATNDTERFRLRLLERAIAEIVAFQTVQSSTPFADSNLPSVRGRLALLDRWEAMAASEAARARWVEFDRARADHPELAKIPFEPRIDLLPIGVDPTSGNFEFAHLATGIPPERDENGRLILSETSSIVLVLLPGGRFTMGASRTEPPNLDPHADPTNEEPVLSVELSPLLVSKFEMTQSQWTRVTGSNPSNHSGRSFFVDEDLAWRYPVENVTWLQCVDLLPRLGLSLPTEAQWEFVARGGHSTPYPMGQEIDLLRSGSANLADRTRARELGAQCAAHHDDLDDGFVMHAPVGSFVPSPAGLHDLFGNVWEWCADDYVTYARPPRAGDGLRSRERRPSLAIYRGGAFDTLAIEARVANRAGAPPDVRQFSVGVRPLAAISFEGR